MTTEVKKLLKQASRLPAIDRAELVEELLTSFDFPQRKKIDALWAKESEQRLKAFQEGRMKSKSVAQVFAKIQNQK